MMLRFLNLPLLTTIAIALARDFLSTWHAPRE